MKELTFKKNGTTVINGVEQPLITGYISEIDPTSEKVSMKYNEAGGITGYKFNSELVSTVYLDQEQIAVVNEIIRKATIKENLARSLLKSFVYKEIKEQVDSVKVDVPIIIKI